MRLAAFTLAMLVAAPAVARSPRVERGKITRFADVGDRWRGGKSPCLGRRVEHTDWGVAHRTLPCGTLVRVTNRRTGLTVVAPVITRGPYGATLDDGTWVIKRRAADPGAWRGILDATPPVFHALAARSFDRVAVETVE